MKKRKILKTVLYFIGALLLFGVISFATLYYFAYGKFEVDTQKFPHYVGYINKEKALLNDVYELCDKGALYKVHHGAPEDAFEGSKKQFRNYIITHYENKSYNDSGYLNFRFLVNCEGNAGWFEIIEMNLQLEETKLNQNMVQQLFKLTSNPENWAVFTYDGQPRNYYMYISYRIENGEILEILP